MTITLSDGYCRYTFAIIGKDLATKKIQQYVPPDNVTLSVIFAATEV